MIRKLNAKIQTHTADQRQHENTPNRALSTQKEKNTYFRQNLTYSTKLGLFISIRDYFKNPDIMPMRNFGELLTCYVHELRMAYLLNCRKLLALFLNCAII